MSHIPITDLLKITESSSESPSVVLLGSERKTHSPKDRDTNSRHRWTSRQTDGLREGQTDFHWLLEVAALRLGRDSLTVFAAQPLPVAELSRGPRNQLAPCSPPGLTSSQAETAPQPHTSYTHSNRDTHAHTKPPTHGGRPSL